MNTILPKLSAIEKAKLRATFSGSEDDISDINIFVAVKEPKVQNLSPTLNQSLVNVILIILWRAQMRGLNITQSSSAPSFINQNLSIPSQGLSTSQGSSQQISQGIPVQSAFQSPSQQISQGIPVQSAFQSPSQIIIQGTPIQFNSQGASSSQGSPSQPASQSISQGSPSQPASQNFSSSLGVGQVSQSPSEIITSTNTSYYSTLGVPLSSTPRASATLGTPASSLPGGSNTLGTPPPYILGSSATLGVPVSSIPTSSSTLGVSSLTI